MKSQNKSNTTFQVGQNVTVTIKRLGINGEGVGYVDRQVIFVAGALPDEVVLARVTKVEKNYAHGTIVKILIASQFRVQPMCPVYEECGGCQLQHFAYEGQLQAKQELVIEAFKKYTKMKKLSVRKTIGMDHP